MGELKRDLIATLRHADNKRVPRSKGRDRRGQIPDMVSIHVRPSEIEVRQHPGHWEGDRIKCAAKASAELTLVERTSRLLMLIKLPEFKPASAVNMMQAFSDKLLGIAEPASQSTRYGQDRKMAMYKELSKRTGMAVYFMTRTALGSVAPTNTPTDWYASTCTRAPTAQATVRNSSTSLPIRSTADLAKVWAYDPRWRSIGRYCSTARSIPPSFIEPQGLPLKF